MDKKNHTAQISDQDLVDAANKGDENAMQTLYLRYREWVYALAWRICGNREDAQDVLQEVFSYFFNKFPGFQLRSQLKTFLYPVVKNTSLNHIRKRKRIVPLDESFAETIPDSSRAPDLELKNLLERLEGLSKTEQELIFLRFFEEFSLVEIAELLHLPLGTVKSRLHRLLARLRDHFRR